jgi:transposase
MLKKEDWMYIKAQVERGVYQKDIARELGVHPKTISRALNRGGPPRGKRPEARGSKLDPFKPLVDELLGKHIWNGMVIFREIQLKGYTGGTTILRDYIKPKRPLREGRATVRFETEPGQQRCGSKRSQGSRCKTTGASIPPEFLAIRQRFTFPLTP